MITIEVHRTGFSEPTFASADEAVRSARSGERSRRAEADSERIRGCRIVGTLCVDQALAIQLDNGQFLNVVCKGEVVDWSIDQTPVSGASKSGNTLEPALLRRLGGDQSIETVWDRGGLLTNRHGATVEGIFAGTKWLYLYVDERPTILFMPLHLSKDSSALLYWDESA